MTEIDDATYYRKYEQAFNATDLPLRPRQAFSHWFAESDWDDPVAALENWKRFYISVT